MDLLNHAKDELQLAELLDDSNKKNAKLGQNVLELIRCFVLQNHTPASAQATLEIFIRIARHKNLTPITDNPAEWEEKNDGKGSTIWQNTRDPALFSKDGGITFIDTNTKKEIKSLVTGKNERAKLSNSAGYRNS